MSIALVLGLIRLGTPSLWIDETFTAHAVRRSYTGVMDQNHWLYYWIEKVWASVAGTSEWALRMPSVFGAMAACGLLVLLGRRLFDQRVALISAVLLATNPFVVKWSQQARGYTLLVALSLVATLLLLRALDRVSPAAWAGYGLAFAVLIVWHPFSAALLAPVHLVLVLQRRESVRAAHALIATTVAVVLAGPWLVVVAQRESEGGGPTSWLDAPTLGVVTHALLDVSGAAGLGVVLALVGLWVLRREEKQSFAVWLGVWAFGPLVYSLAASAANPIFLDRYLIVSAPAFALLAGNGLAAIRPPWPAVLGTAAVVATTVGLVLWYSRADGDNWRGENWRMAVATVSERRGADEALLAAPWWGERAISYYSGRVEGSVPESRSAWVLVWSEGDPGFSETSRIVLRLGRHRLVEELSFGRRVRAQHWERRP
jgi:mannosyltransferase